MSHTGDYARVVVRNRRRVQSPAQVGAGRRRTRPARRSGDRRGAGPAARLAGHAARAERFRVRQGVEIQLDGNPANIVDLSIVGVQVLSPTILRPNQKVRVSIPNDDFVMRFRGVGRVGEVRAAASRPIRRATARAWTSPMRTPPRSTSSAARSGNSGSPHARAAGLADRTSALARTTPPRSSPRGRSCLPRSEPVEMIAAGTPVTSSSRAM